MGVLNDVYEMLNTCNKCGFCLTACKTYKTDLREPMSPRGRIQLIKKLVDGVIEPDRDYEDAINSCLLCGECAVACPSGVKGNELVLAARRDLKLRHGIKPFAKSFALKTLASPSRLEHGFNFFKGVGKGILKKVDGLDYFRGVDIRNMPVAEKPFLEQVPEQITVSNPQKKVAFFVGCFLNHSLDGTAHSVVKVLTKNNCDVILPKDQVCCGLPQYAYGDFERAKANARKTIESFLDCKPDAVLTACASCGSMLRDEYLKLFADEPGYLPRVKEFCAKVFEFSEFVEDQIKLDESKLKAHTSVKVTYHDPCHMARHLKITSQPRKVLRSIPRLQFVEMNEANRCCGASGLVQAFYHELSTDITRQKTQNIVDSGAEVVATSCPACMLRIQGGLNFAGKKQTVVHVADLLAKAYED
ncbi:lactate utilization protein A [Peptococcaceae bacterium CEB3]|nr:lactate utilization protein A [Peptococcaceae bacterium CEB3]